jgi:hypothetical protein
MQVNEGSRYYTAYPRPKNTTYALQVIGSGATRGEALVPITRNLERVPLEPRFADGWVVLLNESAVNLSDGIAINEMIDNDPFVHAIYKIGVQHGRAEAEGRSRDE